MTLEELNEGTSLVKQIIEAENDLRELEEWRKNIEEDNEMVWLSSKEKPVEKQRAFVFFTEKRFYRSFRNV